MPGPVWGQLSVVVLAGGPSAEREISLQSGRAVVAALRQRGHQVRLVDPLQTDLQTYPWKNVDAVFVALHGAFGEDGQVQRLLQELGVPFTGSDADASAVAFSKSAAKERFAQHDVPTPPYALVHRSDEPDRLRRTAQALGFPLVVKPDQQGSSLGVSWVDSPDQLAAALDECFQYDAFAVLERAVVGQEWTVALLDETAFPPIRIVPAAGFFDFRSKYEDEKTRYLFPTPEQVVLARTLVETARAACRAVGVSGLARVDLRVDQRGQPWVLEINTVPGLTDHSLVPKAAARAGLSLGELCEEALVRCLERQEARRRSA